MALQTGPLNNSGSGTAGTVSMPLHQQDEALAAYTPRDTATIASCTMREGTGESLATLTIPACSG